MVLLSLHGSAAGHARFDRSKNSTFSAPSELLAATRTGGSQATLASYQPCAVIKSHSVLHLQPRRACAARCSQRGPEGPSRKLRPVVYLFASGIGIGRNSPQRFIYMPGPARTATGWRQRGGLCWAEMVEKRRWGEADLTYIGSCTVTRSWTQYAWS